MIKLNNVEGFEIDEMFEVRRRHVIRGAPVFHIEHKNNRLLSKPGKYVALVCTCILQAMFPLVVIEHM